MVAPGSVSASPARHDAQAHAEPESHHAFLRRVTRDLHDRVDAAYATYDLRCRAGLFQFLVRQAQAVLPLERAIEDCGAAARLANWEGRRRGAALVSDLARLGHDRPTLAGAPDLPSSLHGLGAVYVLEGSKLGGRILLRQVTASPDLGIRAASQFLSQFDLGGWRAFLMLLDGLEADASTRAALEAGAKTAFAQFLTEPAEAEST